MGVCGKRVHLLPIMNSTFSPRHTKCTHSTHANRETLLCTRLSTTTPRPCLYRRHRRQFAFHCNHQHTNTQTQLTHNSPSSVLFIVARARAQNRLFCLRPWTVGKRQKMMVAGWTTVDAWEFRLHRRGTNSLFAFKYIIYETLLLNRNMFFNSWEIVEWTCRCVCVCAGYVRACGSFNASPGKYAHLSAYVRCRCPHSTSNNALVSILCVLLGFLRPNMFRRFRMHANNCLLFVIFFCPCCCLVAQIDMNIYVSSCVHNSFYSFQICGTNALLICWLLRQLRSSPTIEKPFEIGRQITLDYTYTHTYEYTTITMRFAWISSMIIRARILIYVHKT